MDGGNKWKRIFNDIRILNFVRSYATVPSRACQLFMSVFQKNYSRRSIAKTCRGQSLETRKPLRRLLKRRIGDDEGDINNNGAEGEEL